MLIFKKFSLPTTYYLLSTVFLLATVLLGCAGTQEVCKGILGVSTKVLEDNREYAIKKEFSYDLITCHNKIKAILKKAGSSIYNDDLAKDMLAVYVSEEDTTPVGIFLTERGKDTTLVEVSSPSTYGKEKIAKTIFDALTTGVMPTEEKGQVNAGKFKL